MNEQFLPTAEQPTRARYVTVFWLCSMAAVLYLDRVGWAQAAPRIQDEFKLDNVQVSYLHMGFTIAYALFEIPTGHWGESIGARAILTRITVWWSIFTALTGAGTGFWSLLIVRFMFGAGEAGAYPNAARVYTRWFPKHERGRFQGMMLAVALIGGAASPFLAAKLIEQFGWRVTFVIFGGVGLIWATGFWLWFRDDPGTHSAVNASELALIRAGGGSAPPAVRPPVPWGQVFTNSGFWILSFLIMISSFNAYFYFSWFTKYLQSAHGQNNVQSGKLTSLALAGAATGMLLGGVIADRFVKGGRSPILYRKVFCSGAFATAALLLWIAVHPSTTEHLSQFTLVNSIANHKWVQVGATPLVLSALAALSCFCVQLTLPTWWSSAIEQSGRYVGTLFGMMNMVGQFGAVASQYFVGWFADRQKALNLSGRAQWDPMFNIFVIALLIGSVGWMIYHYKPLEDEESESELAAA
jgi:ACS family glucarate transporter-like MFS transporter